MEKVKLFRSKKLSAVLTLRIGMLLIALNLIATVMMAFVAGSGMNDKQDAFLNQTIMNAQKQVEQFVEKYISVTEFLAGGVSIQSVMQSGKESSSLAESSEFPALIKTLQRSMEDFPDILGIGFGSLMEDYLYTQRGERLDVRLSSREYYETAKEHTFVTEPYVDSYTEEIPVLVLESSKRRNLYEMKELAGECALRLYLMREDYSLTKGFLIDLGFETDRIYHLGGERMRRDDGFAVEIYDHIPYKTPAYKKQMRQLFEKAHLLEGYTFVSGLDDKTRLAYLLARASYLYVTRELLVRQLLDLYLLHKKLKEEDLEREWLWLKKLKIGQLSEKLLSLSYVWFGTKAERADLAITVSEDLELYDEMENRILGYGKEYEATIPEALALAGSILKEEEKENRKARRKLFLQKTRELRKQLWELLREYLPRKEKK